MKVSYLLAAAPAVLAVSPAGAQERGGDIIVTAIGAPQDASTTGQAVTVIDRDMIEQRQTIAISDLLATTPGVTVTRNGGLGTLTSLRIRGGEGDQTLVLIDGVRVNDPAAPGGGFDFASLLATNVERVEVLRGPNSVPWGSQAIGGVVNIMTKAPSEGLQARGNVEYGSMDTLFASSGVSGSSGIVSGALTGGYLRTDGISAFDGGAERDGYRQYGASARGEVAFTPDLGLDLRGFWADSRTDLDGFPAPAFAFADTDEYSTAEELYGYAGLHADILDGRWRNTIAFQIANVDRDNYDRDAGAEPLFLTRGRSERYTYKGDIDAMDRVRLIVGAEHEDTRFSDGVQGFSRGTTSVWAEAITTPLNPLTITGAIRHDDDDAFGGRTTFGANAALAVRAGTVLRGSYAEGFKAPTLYQLYAPFYGTASLRPETAESWDVGVEQRLLGDALLASATWFHRDTVNQIDFDPLTFTYSNIARTHANGLEIGLVARPVEGLTLAGSYSLIDTENRSVGFEGNQLARRPRHSGSVSADYRFAFGLSLGGTVQLVGDSFDNAANTARLDGYTLVAVRAEMPVAERWSIYGRVENAFDEEYQVVRGYGTIGRAVHGGVRLRFD
ncbi:TonB-dependent receptor [Croceibacterium sp. TMG7-5b_MA50]|uniref:TonB-dependent receptor plug domain-containing protein n=1 Tax=Croceibacterium sp. TMG7-5b_MA50 TaxID=3121290 RepID=UPI0032221CF9